MDSALLMLAAGTGFHGFAMTAAKDYFFNNASRRFFLNLFMNLIPIERKFSHESFVEYLAATRAFLDVGDRNLIIYPEGTRSLDGKMGRFKRGPAVVAVELGIPIVPACIEGSHRCWPKGKGFIRPGGVKVTIGEPVYPDSAAVAASADSPSAPFDEYRRLIAEVETRVGELYGNQVPDPVDCVAG
jgi:1-acyl-sn-glycerol-3-phosphate acyltransferase